MKTLIVQTNGMLEFNVDGSCYNTDIIDNDLSSWAVVELNKVIHQLNLDGAHYVQFEDNGYFILKHERRLGSVEEWPHELPSIFLNLEKMVSEYKASQESNYGN